MKTLRRPRLLVPLLALPLACHMRVFATEGIEVDGTRLTLHHQEVLALSAWPAQGLQVESRQGDVEVVKHEGPTEVEVQVYELEPGMAHTAIEEGRLVAHAGGKPCAIGKVTIRTADTAPHLTLATGLGDVRVREVKLDGVSRLSTGLGDIEVVEAGDPAELLLSTGMGDIEVRGVSGSRLVAETGTGDIDLRDVKGPGGEFSTGLGDVVFQRCTLVHAKASTGLGDVVARDSSFEQRDFSTGLGSVEDR